jgi:hypothetical protein
MPSDASGIATNGPETSIGPHHGETLALNRDGE